MLTERGIEPRVVEYLKTPPSRDEVRKLAVQAGVPLRALLRENTPPYAELGLADESLPDEALLDAIEAHPVLLNRPIVITPKGTALCRPKEKLLDLI
jgi:arsenate reductase (glutaredoxin)